MHMLVSAMPCDYSWINKLCHALNSRLYVSTSNFSRQALMHIITTEKICMAGLSHTQNIRIVSSISGLFFQNKFLFNNLLTFSHACTIIKHICTQEICIYIVPSTSAFLFPRLPSLTEPSCLPAKQASSYIAAKCPEQFCLETGYVCVCVCIYIYIYIYNSGQKQPCDVQSSFA